MERVDAVLRHPLFTEHIQKNMASEATRIFCKHDLPHALDVARIAYILCLEEGLDAPKETVYAAAILHDITRWRQYAEGVPHNESAVVPAALILRECGFAPEEISMICGAILHHRDGAGDETFAKLLYRADKLSRACFDCPAAAECNWDDSRKNLILRY